jgi:hypothetical protein
MVSSKRHDTEAIWADLQACLFAAIVVERILRPNLQTIRANGGRTKPESRAYAAQRSRDLLDLLEIPDDAAMFAVANVRDPLEHFDERIDSAALSGAASVTDWYVSHGAIARTPAGVPKEQASLGLRVFVAPLGLLLFDDQQLDLFALDISLLALRANMPDAREKLRNSHPSAGRYYFGSGQLVSIGAEHWQQRLGAFLVKRTELGHPLDIVSVAYDSPNQAGPA